ncbi:hypothetical protein TK06_28810 [Pseudomonas fluorescens]|uniref:Uncharacterized protein n=1 Tax=Pseudomonas fluorescens TaxID=294 RepID=A0A165ZQJ1_PSEFL|nr:hypothetical protein TK06_28810 [Pseudomonas fluorescens]
MSFYTRWFVHFHGYSLKLPKHKSLQTRQNKGHGEIGARLHTALRDNMSGDSDSKVNPIRAMGMIRP